MDTQSESIGKLVEALAKAQSEIGSAMFDSINPHFKNKYASYAALRKVCISPLSSNGLALTHHMIYTPDFKRIMVTQLSHSSGEWMRSYLLIPQEKETPQGVGSSITYSKRYSLSAFLALCADEDGDDGEKAEAPYQNIIEDQNITEEQAKYLESMIPPEAIEFRAGLLNYMSAQAKISPPASDFRKLPKDAFEACKIAIQKKMQIILKAKVSS